MPRLGFFHAVLRARRTSAGRLHTRRICTFARALLIAAPVLGGPPLRAADNGPLQLIGKIPLGAVSGRIDHMALDRPRHRLFIAQLGNDSVGVIDLEHGTVLKRITGLSEPQGVGYVPSTDTLVIANGGDGSVRGFRGAALAPVGRVDLQHDADNVRVDAHSNLAWVGFGSGALAAIDTAAMRKTAEIPLKDHPESFQIDGARIFVNIPDARQIAVVDTNTNRQIAGWHKLPASANFPMAILGDGARIAIAFRSPARLVELKTADGSVVADLPTCGDADDLFVDQRRDRVYVSCGQGAIDVFAGASTTPQPLARVTTAPGARTSFFDPDEDRYYLAVRGGLMRHAQILVYQPQ